MTETLWPLRGDYLELYGQDSRGLFRFVFDQAITIEPGDVLSCSFRGEPGVVTGVTKNGVPLAGKMERQR